VATGYTILPRATILPEQILTYFGITIDDTNKCVCPFHQETVPSMQVNKDYVYCFGCKWAGDIWRLATELNPPGTHVGQWLQTTSFPSPTGRTYRVGKYQGSVSTNLIDYWHNCLLGDTQALSILMEERLFNKNTVDQFKLGWRPDKKAYVIPFMYNGEAEIVQFRSTTTNEAGSKYWGLEGHQRGCFINRHILDTPQEYVVILMGAFDPILAYQDGLPAVGMNGSMPFKRSEKEYVQDVFKHQTIKFVVPDNNEQEIKEAKKLASWIGGDVRTFPYYLPHNMDYIDYRKAGFTVDNFKAQVLHTLPLETIPNDLFLNLCSLYDAGDPHKFSSFHCEWYAKGITYSDVAITLANRHVKNKVAKRALYNVVTKTEFIEAMNLGYSLSGGW